MRILAVSLSLVLFGALLAIAYVLLVDPAPRSPGRLGDLEALLSTVPDAPKRATLSREVSVRADRLEAVHGSWLGQKREALRPLWGVAVLRARAAVSFIPPALALAGTAFLLGLSRRERAKLTFAYCSSTWSYVGKHAVAFAIAGYVFTALCPLGWPVWTLYLWAGLAALGTGLYVAHLPPKI